MIYDIFVLRPSIRAAVSSPFAMTMQKIPCSILVLTRNAEKTLEHALKNLSPFGEILVHDANSEDGTVAIAQKYGARVLKQYDTEEKSVRVKDFTEIRLKQRRDAAYDWVLYLDADEEMSEELVTEIGEILSRAHEKTIIKVPRLPIVEGTIVRHGAFWPEIVPRVHHREGGCTLRRGKTVHEKYVYDASFTEVVTKAPLYVPMEPLEELLRKDETYIALEKERSRTQGRPPFWHFVQWVVLREPLIMLHILLRTLWCRMRYGTRGSLPLQYEWRNIRYHARLFAALLRAYFTKV